MSLCSSYYHNHLATSGDIRTATCEQSHLARLVASDDWYLTACELWLPEDFHCRNFDNKDHDLFRDRHLHHLFSPSISQCLVVRRQSPFPSSTLVSSFTTLSVSSRVRRIPGNDYKLLHSLGEGAYGTVVAALHKPSARQVAIKKVLPFEHTLFCLRNLRELKLLRFFSETCMNENASCASRMPQMLFIDNDV
jgi:hypothetical protein